MAPIASSFHGNPSQRTHATVTPEVEPEAERWPEDHRRKQEFRWFVLLYELERLTFKRNAFGHLGQRLAAVQARGKGKDHPLLRYDGGSHECDRTGAWL